MTDTEIGQYLTRIHVEDPVSVDLSSLRKLQWAHMQTIAFENLDIIQGIPLSLNRDDLFRKIVLNGRGGVCAELNGLFNWLLESLGYDVTSYLSRIISEQNMYPLRSHRLMGVHFEDRTWLTDVGFYFEHHRQPILLQDGVSQYDGIHRYFLQKECIHGWIMRHEREDRKWHAELSFTEEPQLDVDFVAPLYYSQYHPLSPTNKCLKGSIYAGEEMHLIKGNEYTKTYHGKTVFRETELSEEDVEKIFKTILKIG